jgi:very-short-patch-repair endonuclease
MVATQISEERRAAVDRASQAWIRRLIDLSRRNNLLYYRPLRTATLELASADPEKLAGLLGGEKTQLSGLLPEDQEVEASARVQEIRRRAVANLEEKGLETLFLAVGMASWSPADEGRPPMAPVLLVPVSIESRGRESRALSLLRVGEAQVNPVLLHVLQFELGAFVRSEDLLAGQTSIPEDDPIDMEPILARLEEAAGDVKGFATNRRVVLGNFAFQKMAMVRDLRDCSEELAAHDLIAALAGDGDARSAILSARPEIDPESLDRVLAKDEFLVLDADSSQERVAHAVIASQDGVVQGPPGTGKSQTIANLIAALAARGKRVLFVAEKRAALEAVLRRLEQVGLGHLALDLHGADVSRRAVMASIAESLELVREAAVVDAERLHREFEDRRARLNAHVRAMHTPLPPSGKAVYQLQGELIAMPSDIQATTRWRGAELDRMTEEVGSRISDLLVEAGGFDRLFLRTDPSPWTQAELLNGTAAQEAIDLARGLNRDWPQVLAGAELADSAGLSRSRTLATARAAMTLLQDVRATLETYDPAIFEQDLQVLTSALAPALGSRVRALVARLWSRRYRHARRTLRSCRKTPASTRQLASEADAATDQLKRWLSTSVPGSLPHSVHGVSEVAAMLEDFAARARRLGGYWPGWETEQIVLDSLGPSLLGLAADGLTPARLPRLRQLERELADLGAAPKIAELRESKPSPSLWPASFRQSWLASCLDRAREQNPGIAGFSGRTQDQFVADFRRLDEERLRVAAARVARSHAETVITAMNAHPDQATLVRSEARKRARHLPLRRTFAQAADVLTALRPCWLASPLSVSQLLPTGRRYFDVVMFDEASQVLPEDAVPSLMRGAQAVVAGDDKQLPPTIFFDVSGESEESEEEEFLSVAGFQSVLDLMAGFLPPWTLDWHYRSRSESLIAFSNHHMYRDRLVTFPDPGRESAVRHVLVDQQLGSDGQEESSSAEVARVVKLVLDHATEMMQRVAADRETLGVIAMGIKHARRIEGALDQALNERADLDEFFDQHLAERFFVKNLERVQGDERDAIILSVGYGKDRSGRLLYRFGPLNMEGGERRLNVAITRARRRMTLVSSFGHADMDPSRTASRGAQLLREYLEFAASGGKVLSRLQPGHVALNDFEQAVSEALSVRGLELLSQWGASVYRIDLVAKHPSRPGRLVLAIECDGATYHSAQTARDRDRLRQQHLEALGWRFHRIWSTDWFTRPDEEIERAVSAFEEAVAYADRLDAGERLSIPDSEMDLEQGSDKAMAPKVSARGTRPGLGPQRPITDYSLAQLRQLVAWIKSDGRLRTDEEVVEEMVRELGFSRRGHRIDAVLRSAVASYRTRLPRPRPDSTQQG